jgi:hypothetical protein
MLGGEEVTATGEALMPATPRGAADLANREARLAVSFTDDEVVDEEILYRLASPGDQRVAVAAVPEVVAIIVVRGPTADASLRNKIALRKPPTRFGRHSLYESNAHLLSQCHYERTSRRARGARRGVPPRHGVCGSCEQGLRAPRRHEIGWRSTS